MEAKKGEEMINYNEAFNEMDFNKIVTIEAGKEFIFNKRDKK